MDTRVTNVADIISLWPSAEAFAKDLGLKHIGHGRVMKLRGRIPRQHWPRVLAAAERRSIPITEQMLEQANGADSQVAS